MPRLAKLLSCFTSAVPASVLTARRRRQVNKMIISQPVQEQTCYFCPATKIMKPRGKRLAVPEIHPLPNLHLSRWIQPPSGSFITPPAGYSAVYITFQPITKHRHCSGANLRDPTPPFVLLHYKVLLWAFQPRTASLITSYATNTSQTWLFPGCARPSPREQRVHVWTWKVASFKNSREVTAAEEAE